MRQNRKTADGRGNLWLGLTPCIVDGSRNETAHFREGSNAKFERHALGEYYVGTPVQVEDDLERRVDISLSFPKIPGGDNPGAWRGEKAVTVVILAIIPHAAHVVVGGT
jgi:hypothetical protein